LTEIYLCNVCSCQEILRRNGLQLVGSVLATQIWPSKLGRTGAQGLTAATVGILGCLLLFLATRSDDPRAVVKASADNGRRWKDGGGRSVQTTAPLLAKARSSATATPGDSLRQFTMVEALLTLDFWILFMAFLLSSGAGAGAGGDHGIDRNKNRLRFSYGSTFWRSHDLHPHR
jgi:hypothetical protein